MILLRHVSDLLAQRRSTVVNIDATVVMEAPKIAPYIDLMRQNIADALKITPEQVSIKATTHEGLGFIGAGEGASAHAVAMVNVP